MGRGTRQEDKGGGVDGDVKGKADKERSAKRYRRNISHVISV